MVIKARGYDQKNAVWLHLGKKMVNFEVYFHTYVNGVHIGDIVSTDSQCLQVDSSSTFS